MQQFFGDISCRTEVRGEGSRGRLPAMWLTDLVNGAPGGAVVAAAALLWQKNREQRHADKRAEQDRKDAAEREVRDHQRDKQAASREERKIAHTRALSALGAIWDVAANDQITMMMQSVKNQNVQTAEKVAILANAKEHAQEGAVWKDNTIEVLAERIHAVAVFGSPESARAAKAAQQAAVAMYFFTNELGWGTEISDEQSMEQSHRNLMHEKAVAEYLVAVKVDLGTDS